MSQEKQHIAECMIRNVEIIDSETPLTEVLDVMNRKNIGSILVKDSGNFGIFTERDLLHKINAGILGKRDLNTIKIKEFMTKDLKTIRPQDSYKDVIDLMQKYNIRHMPVVDNGSIVGIVSFRDLMKYHGRMLEEVNQELSDKTSQLSHKTIKLNAILKLSEQLISNMETNELLCQITKAARELVHADTASVILLKEQESNFAIMATESTDSRLEHQIIQPSLDESKSITGWVLKNKQPLLLFGRPDNDPRFKNIRWKEGIKCSMNIPLMYKNSVKGTLNLNITHSDYTFTQEDFETAIALGNHVTVAIENSNLFKELQESLIQYLRIANDRMKKKNEELRIAQEKIENEIRIVSVVQQGLLPKSLPRNKDMDIAAYYSASAAVGGDYYDCIEMDEGKLGLVIADITGHGLPAAFIMTMVKILLFYLNQQKIELEDSVAIINKILSTHIPISTFPSLVYGILDPQKMTLEYINAGHEPLVRINAGTGRKDYYYAKATLLGIETEVKFTKDIIQIEKGDKLVFYTDGIPEAMNKEKDAFGREKLFEVLQNNISKDPKAIIDSVIQELNSFSQGVPYPDDITMMVLGF